MKDNPGLLYCQRGFILAVTVWVLAAVTLSAGFFSLWANRAVELARFGQEDLQRQRDLISTRSVLLYLLGTQPVNYGGLTVPDQGEQEDRQKKVIKDLMGSVSPLTGEELALDDRIYKGFGSTYFSIQDEGGLLGLNVFQAQQFNRLLGVLGVSAEDRQPMIDKLLDYIDRDDLHRLNGAESAHYQELGLPSPANRSLFTSWEARNVLDWGTYKQLWENNRLPRLTTVARGGIPNCNTAPSLVLQSFAGIDEEIAARIIDARQNAPLTSLTDLNRAAGKTFLKDPMGLFFLPTSRLRLTIRADGDIRFREIHVSMTAAAANGAPWLIDYELTLPHTGIQQGVEIKDTGIPLFATPLFAGERQDYTTSQ